MPHETPPRRPRNWLDALVATALRWNDRLSRPLHRDGAVPASGPENRQAVGIRQGDAPGPPLPRSR